jgi:acyl carrier protein
MSLEDVFERVLEEPADSFNDDSSPDTVLTWTSLRHVTLLVEIENEYGTRFSNAEMTTMRSMGDIRAALAKRPWAVTCRSRTPTCSAQAATKLPHWRWSDASAPRSMSILTLPSGLIAPPVVTLPN